ncbi:arylsulfotransferase family protein [Haloprofundus salinisoli]|uniref:arylsulfotransferase family protein n=1 Tax=Haloprofundus salinisoli TaxID=2876193 RepID=UPI001CC9D8EB|nr:arylsulfotransferase family protein [Haloprofundus salinisoli]
MAGRISLRVIFAALIAFAVLAVGVGYVSSATESTFESNLAGDGVADPSAQIAPEADGITVVATDSNSWRGESADGPRARAELVAFDPDGSTLYYNDTHTRYWDVDPVEGTDATVEYLYADHLDPEQCPDEWDPETLGVDRETLDTYLEAHSDVNACTRNGIERVNLTTGEVEQVYSVETPGKHSSRWHDGDRVNETHYAVADILFDRMFVVNTETDEVEWTWNASEEFDTDDTGGPYAEDWTHMNDVEVLDDGRFMLSPRNLDRVLFVKPGEGVQKNWTLGEEDNYDILNEQHNPDYIPESEGGPAVIIGDSENNRVVEYQRQDGEWVETWKWRDARMQWPRDADRLPNGHTLISDSNGNRVFEVNEEGEIVWSVNIAFPYESERLGTGDESSGGPSAQSAGIGSRNPSIDEQFWIGLKNVIPGKYLNGLMYITPVWMGIPELFALAVGLVGLVGLVAVEVGRFVSRRRGRATDANTATTRDGD